MPKTERQKSRRQQEVPNKKEKGDCKSWVERLEELKQYRQVNGNCRVPKRYKANPQLGNWVKSQRQEYKKGKLSKEQIKLLQGIGFEWAVLKVVGWDERFEELKQYSEANGHCNVPYRYKAIPQLGQWVSDQRQLYKKNKLLPDRIKLLKEIGFEWISSKVVSWDERFEELKQYKQVNGNCNVSTLDKDYKELGKWVDNQRQLYKNGKLSKERIESLQGIGFSWNPDEDKWNEMYEELERYRKKNGHCNISQYDEDNKQLGSWVNNQRTKYKKGKLSPEQKERLEGIGFVWVSRRGPMPAQKREDGPMPAPQQQREKGVASMAVEVHTLQPVAESCQV